MHRYGVREKTCITARCGLNYTKWHTNRLRSGRGRGIGTSKSVGEGVRLRVRGKIRADDSEEQKQDQERRKSTTKRLKRHDFQRATARQPYPHRLRLSGSRSANLCSKYAFLISSLLARKFCLYNSSCSFSTYSWASAHYILESTSCTWSIPSSLALATSFKSIISLVYFVFID